jgi:hypothetical protein
VNNFVDECRREWRRLRVPGHIADEMAAELAADLEEGAPEDVLGSDWLDARAFAARWAAERGVARSRRTGRLLVLAATLALVAVAAVGAALTRTATSTASATPVVHMDGDSIWVTAPEMRSQPPRFQENSGGASHTIGWALLIAGLGGIALLALAREVPDTLKVSGTG